MASTARERLAPWSRHVASWARRNVSELTACGFAATWFCYLGYGPTVRPTNIAWMFRDDWATYLWGFCFFRNSAWSWPLGNTPELFWPFGTSVGFTDANPWASLLFKALSPVLPLDFQFSGMWFLLCFVLQALVGTRITAAFTKDKVVQALGGCLFAATPLLPSRHAHIALSGFFFVTAGVCLNLKPLASRADVKSSLVVALALVVWGAGTHGYLSVMLLMLILTFCLTLWNARLLALKQAALWAAGFVAATVVVYFVFGLIGWKSPDLTAEGFGQFSGDLTALVNPMGWSRWMPTLAHRPRQWEGFSYLGLGVLALLVLRVVLSATSPRATLQSLRSRWPLLLVLGVMWFYSLSSSVAYLGEEVWSLKKLYDPFSAWTGIFRSSGRFSWPLHMALIAAAVSAAAAIRYPWVGRTVLLVAVLVQGAEFKQDRLSFRELPMARLSHPAWSSVSGHYKHLETVPLHLLWVCRYDARLVDRLSYEAYRRKLTINSGNVMRKEPGVKALCERHLRPEQPLDPQTIYVVDERYLGDFRRADAACGAIDELIACVSTSNPSPMLDAVRARPVR
jgi:hypothetical protein